MTEEWVVASDWLGYLALPVVKRSLRKVVATDKGRDRHFLMGDVIAVLPEVEAKRMAERLTSSKALLREDTNRAERRHADRIVALKEEFSPKAVLGLNLGEPDRSGESENAEGVRCQS